MGGVATLAVLIVVLAVFVVAPALGSQDKSSLARQATTQYWTDIGHGQIRTAYHMLTSGNQAAIPLSQFSQNMFDFLGSTAGVRAAASTTVVNGDLATVRVKLFSPKTSVPLKAYQHLFWENGHWRISDPNGGLSTRP
jgi:hypothetical protein